MSKLQSWQAIQDQLTTRRMELNEEIAAYPGPEYRVTYAIDFEEEAYLTWFYEGYEFDTTAFKAINKHGHDTDIEEDGKTYKLNWSDDPDGAMAIIEYMKTL